MDTQNVQEEAAESDVVTFLRRGGISILEALSVKLPDVFASEILPKLDMTDTLSLAQVNKAYNAAVWSADGVRSMEAKIKPHLVETGGAWTPQPLFWAAKFGNLPAVGACLESGVDVDKVLAEDNSTALHFAAELGQVSVMKALIEAGADVNKTTSGNQTALTFAAMLGQASCVVELIKAGADVKIGVCTPLVGAIVSGHEGIVGMLILAGAVVDKVAPSGGGWMGFAKIHKHENIAKLLEQFGR